MPDLSFLQLQDLALLIFYKSAKEKIKLPTESPTTFHEYRITGHDNFLVAKAIEGLQDKKLVNRAYSFGSAKITARGLERVERELQKAGSTIEQYYQISALKAFAEPTSEQVAKSSHVNVVNVALLDFVPASDRIVTLDDNKPARQKAVEAIQEVITEAEKSNEFGQLFADPNEKAVVLSEMKSVLVILKDEAVARFSTIKNFIADRLAMIVNKIPDAMVGVLAKKAIDALEAFIKGMF